MYYMKNKLTVGFFITVIMLIIGIIIGGSIRDSIADKNAEYNKAIKLEKRDIFEYSMRTSVGNAFVYGKLEAVDTVSFPEIEGEYSYIEKVKEVYTMHTRTVTYTDSKGKTRTKTETYWTWDYAGSEEKKSKEVEFLGSTFKYSQFIEPSSDYLKTIKKSSHIRYKYYVIPKTISGTIYANLKNNNIGNNVVIYRDMKTQEAYEYAKDNYSLIWVFWIIWISLISAMWYVLIKEM